MTCDIVFFQWPCGQERKTPRGVKEDDWHVRSKFSSFSRVPWRGMCRYLCTWIWKLKIIYFGEAHFQCKQSWFFATIIFTASSNVSDHCSLQSNMFMRHIKSCQFKQESNFSCQTNRKNMQGILCMKQFGVLIFYQKNKNYIC